MHSMRLVMRGIDVMMEENPITAFLGIAAIAALAFLLMNGRLYWMIQKIKELPETRQFIAGFGLCMFFLIIIVLFGVLWVTGSNAGYR